MNEKNFFVIFAFIHRQTLYMNESQSPCEYTNKSHVCQGFCKIFFLVESQKHTNNINDLILQ